MIVHTPRDFLSAYQARQWPAQGVALPRAVFLVEPDAFRVDAESAVDNPYMDLVQAADPERALAQSRELQAAIRAAGVEVQVFPGDPMAPDGVFPNNAFATTPGRLIVGRMCHSGRRRETAREDIRAWFAEPGYRLTDLSAQACIAELTGPMILDRRRGIGFCGMTGRVDEAGLKAMHQAFGLRLSFAFELQPGEYHTNVVMSILAGRACVLCPEAFADPAVPDAIEAAFPGRTLRISMAEKNAFVGNCIALTDSDLFLSAAARAALEPAHLERLRGWNFELHAVELDEIEKAGGSLRCMVAEIF
jgi:hypothetical protein